MGRTKGILNKAPSRYWSKLDKYEIVQSILSGQYSANEVAKSRGMKNSGMITNWIKKYQEGGIEALENKRKPGNPLAKYLSRKELTPLEKLQYENLVLRIENERLKKGYTSEEVMALKARRKSKRNIK